MTHPQQHTVTIPAPDALTDAPGIQHYAIGSTIVDTADTTPVSVDLEDGTIAFQAAEWDRYTGRGDADFSGRFLTFNIPPLDARGKHDLLTSLAETLNEARTAYKTLGRDAEMDELLYDINRTVEGYADRSAGYMEIVESDRNDAVWAEVTKLAAEYNAASDTAWEVVVYDEHIDAEHPVHGGLLALNQDNYTVLFQECSNFVEDARETFKRLLADAAEVFAEMDEELAAELADAADES